MRRRMKGFTLVETVMSVTITALVGLAVAGASVALSSAVGDGDDYFECIQGGRGAMRQLRGEIQTCRLVLWVSNDGTKLTYWSGDANKNNMIDLTEITYAQYEPRAKTLATYAVVFPDTWSQSTRDAYDLELTLSEATAASVADSLIAASTYVQARVLGTDIEHLSFSLPADGPLSRLVRIKMTVAAGDRNITLQESVALRAAATDYVTGEDGQSHVLSLPETIITKTIDMP